MANARSTMYNFLMEGTGSGSTLTYAKVVDIKNTPQLQGSAEALDVTTLSNWARVYIPGIEETQSQLSMTANYTLADFSSVKALEGSLRHWAIWFGGTRSGSTVTPTGSAGKFTFDGFLHAHVPEKGVNEVQEMQLDIIPATEIVFSAS